jgi:hypothetical protein
MLTSNTVYSEQVVQRIHNSFAWQNEVLCVVANSIQFAAAQLKSDIASVTDMHDQFLAHLKKSAK